MTTEAPSQSAAHKAVDAKPDKPARTQKAEHAKRPVPQRAIEQAHARFEEFSRAQITIEDQLLKRSVEDIAAMTPPQQQLADATNLEDIASADTVVTQAHKVSEQIAGNVWGGNFQADVSHAAETYIQRESNIQYGWDHSGLASENREQQNTAKRDLLVHIFRHTHMGANDEQVAAFTANLTDDVLSAVEVSRIHGGIVFNNMPTPLFTELLITKMDQGGHVETDPAKISQTIEQNQVAMTVDGERVVGDESSWLHDAKIVFVKRPGQEVNEETRKSMQQAIAHEEHEILGLYMDEAIAESSLFRNYTSRFGSNEELGRIPGSTNQRIRIAIHDLAAQVADVADADTQTTITLSSMGITQEYIDSHPEASGLLAAINRNIASRMEQVRSQYADNPEAAATACHDLSLIIRGGVLQPEILLAYLEGSGDIQPLIQQEITPNEIYGPENSDGQRQGYTLSARVENARFVQFLSRELNLGKPYSIEGAIYQPKGSLGSGGMGAVHEAIAMIDDRTSVTGLRESDPPILIALKEIDADGLSPSEYTDAQRAFINESRAMDMLRGNLRIPDFFGVIQSPYTGKPLIAMQRLHGTSLERSTTGAVRTERAVGITLEMLQALEIAHNTPGGMIHRDIKPGNVLIDRNGEVYVIDWGIAIINAANARPVEALGTAGYIPKEQYDSRAILTRSIDTHAVGMVLYQLLTGKDPATHVLQYDTIRTNMANTHVPLELQRIILRAIAIDPGARFQTATDMKTALMSLRFADSALDTEFVGLDRQHNVKIANLAGMPPAVTQYLQKLEQVPYSVEYSIERLYEFATRSWQDPELATWAPLAAATAMGRIVRTRLEVNGNNAISNARWLQRYMLVLDLAGSGSPGREAMARFKEPDLEDQVSVFYDNINRIIHRGKPSDLVYVTNLLSNMSSRQFANHAIEFGKIRRITPLAMRLVEKTHLNGNTASSRLLDLFETCITQQTFQYTDTTPIAANEFLAIISQIGSISETGKRKPDRTQEMITRLRKLLDPSQTTWKDARLRADFEPRFQRTISFLAAI